MCTWRGCCIVMGKWRGGGMRVLTMMVLTFVGGEVAGMLCVGGDGAHAKVHQLLADSVPLALQLQQHTKTSVKQRDKATGYVSHDTDETNRAEVSCHVRDKQGRGLMSCTRQTG